MDTSYHSLEEEAPEEVKQVQVVRPAHFYHTREAALLPQNERTLNIQRHREREEEKRKVEEENERRLQLEKHKQLAEGKERRRREREEEEMRRRHAEVLLLEEEQALRDMKGSFASLMREVSKGGEEFTVTLAGTDYSPPQTRLFFKALQESKTVSALSLSRQILDIDSLKLLAEALKSNSTLTRLELAAIELNSQTLALLAATLSTNTTLKALNLSFNPLCKPDSTGMTALAEALSVNDSLLCLSLTGCGLGPEDLGALTSCLEKNTRLIILDAGLSDALPPEGLQKLHELIDRNNEKYQFARKCQAEEGAALAAHQFAALAAAKSQRRIERELVRAREDRTRLKAQRAALFAEDLQVDEDSDRRLEAQLEKEALARLATKLKKATKAKG